MSVNLNQVNFAGTISRVDDVKYTQKGSAFVNFTLDYKETYEGKTFTTKMDCTVWGKQAEAVGRFLQVGVNMLVTGSLKKSSYKDRDQKDVWKTEINVQGCQIISTAQANQHPGDEYNQERQPSRGKAQEPAQQEDIPF